ncbi:MAG: hypothetical protein K2P94_00030, partial [Rhodospirillaceae bacterium]|nr:hypothetical protein [Rhodospirillaceae bacterium]
MNTSFLKNNSKALRYALAVFCLAGLTQPAMADPPSVRFRDGALVSPTAANTYYGASTTSTITVCPVIADTAPTCASGQSAEVKEVANGLGANRLSDAEFIRNAFAYVFNNVEITPTFGLSKGAQGAIIEHYGTAFDQAHLLMVLLRQDSSITTTSYKYGTITLNQTQMKNWLGVDNAFAACTLLANGGIPASFSGGATVCSAISPLTTIYTVTMAHIWVEAVAGGITYPLDPSYKANRVFVDPPAGFDLTTKTGLTTAALTTARDGMFAANSPNDGSANLIAVIPVNDLFNSARNNLDTAMVDLGDTKQHLYEVLGGRPAALLKPTDALPGAAPGASASTTWTAIPNQYRTEIKVDWGSLWRTAYGDELATRRFSIANYGEYATRPALSPPGLFLENSYFLQQASAPAPTSFSVSINHPYAAASGAFMDRTGTSKFTKTLTSTTRGAGAGTHDGSDQYNNLTILIALGQIAPEGADYYNQRLQEIGVALEFWDRMKTLAHGYRRTAILGSWLAQVTAAATLYERVNGGIIQHHHSVGFLNDSTSYAHMDVESGLSVAARDGDVTRGRAIKFSFAAMMASLEGTTVATAVGNPLDLSAPGRINYNLNGYPYNYTRWFSSGTPATAAHFEGETTAGLNFLNNTYLLNGFNVIASDKTLVGTGTGINCCGFMPFVAYTTPDYNDVAHMVAADPAMSQFIKGAAAQAPNAGGQASVSGSQNDSAATIDGPGSQRSAPPADETTGSKSTPNRIDETASANVTSSSFGEPGTGPSEANLPNPLSNNSETTLVSGLTIDQATGQPSLRQTDMVIGSGNFPESLPFTRTYSPQDRLSGFLPRQGGWRHIYELRASLSTDVMGAFGAGTNVPARAAASMIVTAKMGVDAFINFYGDGSGQLIAEKLAGGAVTNIIGNVVTVQTFGGTSKFFRRINVDGSSHGYTWSNIPFIGNTDALRNLQTIQNHDDSSWELVTPDGVQYIYNIRTIPFAAEPSASQCDVEVTDYGDTSKPFFGTVSKVIWPSGMQLAFAYDVTSGVYPNTCQQPLLSVTNSFGRKLTFTNTDSQTLTVTDGTGRSVIVKHNQVTLPDGKQINYEFAGGYMVDIGYANSPPLTGSR